jgi:uncharacterized membrane protein
MRTRSIRSVIYLGAGLGLILSLFATAEAFDAALSGLCSVNSYVSCGAVLSSGLTTLLGVPDYAWGIGGFVAILVVAALAERNRRDARWAYALLAVTTAGVAVALTLLYVELALIHAICPVCATAYLMVGVSWIGTIALVRRHAERARNRPRDAAKETEPEPAT